MRQKRPRSRETTLRRAAFRFETTPFKGTIQSTRYKRHGWYRAMLDQNREGRVRGAHRFASRTRAKGSSAARRRRLTSTHLRATAMRWRMASAQISSAASVKGPTKIVRRGFPRRAAQNASKVQVLPVPALDLHWSPCSGTSAEESAGNVMRTSEGLLLRCQQRVRTPSQPGVRRHRQGSRSRKAIV